MAANEVANVRLPRQLDRALWDGRRDDPVSLVGVRRGIEFLGLAGKVVCLHSRLSSFPWIGNEYANYGAAQDIVQVFLDAGCTLVVPTYTERFSCPPPDGLSPARNAISRDAGVSWRYHALVRESWAQTGGPLGYTRRTRLVDVKSMGLVPTAVVRWPGRARGAHPLMSFCAVGPRAREVIRRQTLARPHAHFDAVDSVLMMGTPFERLTLIHYAEERAGRRLFVRWALTGRSAQVRAVRSDGCSEGFAKLEPVLRPLAREVYVGESRWLALPLEPALESAASAIRRDPEVTRCGNRGCERCRDMIAGGPIPRAREPVPVTRED